MITRQDIIKLGEENPIVNDILRAIYVGAISWEQGMLEAVAFLARVNQEQERLITNILSRSVTPPLVVRFDEVGRGLTPAQRQEIVAIVQRDLRESGDGK